MKVSRFSNIETERTTVRYMVQGLAHHPETHALAVFLACHPQQNSTVYQSSATGATDTRPSTKKPDHTQGQANNTIGPNNNEKKSTKHLTTNISPLPRPTSRTHKDMVSPPRKRNTQHRKLLRTWETPSTGQTSVSESGQQTTRMRNLRSARVLQLLESVLARQQETEESKTKRILKSGAHPTHTATPHANMQPSSGTLTQTANGQREKITHRGNITIQTKSRTIQLAAGTHTLHRRKPTVRP